MKKIAMAFIGMGLVSLPFGTYSHAEMKSDNPPAASESGSPQPRGAIQPGQIDITDTKGQRQYPEQVHGHARGQREEGGSQ